MKLAAIDLGSNSIHIVLVEVDAAGGFRVIGREKEMVRLGAAQATGRLSEGAMQRGLATLRRFKALAASQGVESVIAVATSAVREAQNGEPFLERIGKQLGIWVRAISGTEEARLIHLAAVHSIHAEAGTTLVVDIGGGSLELALGRGAKVLSLASEKLGALRMAKQFLPKGSASPKEVARLERHVKRVLAPHLPRLRKRFDRVVGTSGTILALGSLAHGSLEGLHHLAVPLSAIAEVRQGLEETDLASRAEMPGLEGRADTILAGAVVLHTLLEVLGAREIVLCEWALREGILIDYIRTHPRFVESATAYPDLRRRSVMQLAERCGYDAAHAKRVAALSLALFDGTRRRHRLGAKERGLLEFAALLHDIGHAISYPGHHKHTYYLIKNGDLRGFDPVEVELVANVARYHRRAVPRKGHRGFRKLAPSLRATVSLLAGCLRLADALDRSHRQVIQFGSVRLRGTALSIACVAEGDSELEAWGATPRKRLLESTLRLRARLSFSPKSGEPTLRLRSSDE